MPGQSNALCMLVLWNGTMFFPWAGDENTKFILFRTTNPPHPTWNTHFKAEWVILKGPCRHQSLTDNRSSETSSSSRNQTHSLLSCVIWQAWDEVSPLPDRKKICFKLMVWDLSPMSLWTQLKTAEALAGKGTKVGGSDMVQAPYLLI